jgi:proteasome beta subunit
VAHYHVLSKRVKKIFKLEERIGAAVAGSTGDVQTFINLLRAEANLYRLNREQPITTKSLAQLASNILHGRRLFPYILEGMISGLDPDGPKLFFLDPVGGKLEEREFAAAGTGASVAYGTLEREFREELDIGEATKLATRSIQVAIERDAATGERTVVAVIDEKGYRELPDEEVEKLLK